MGSQSRTWLSDRTELNWTTCSWLFFWQDNWLIHNFLSERNESHHVTYQDSPEGLGKQTQMLWAGLCFSPWSSPYPGAPHRLPSTLWELSPLLHPDWPSVLYSTPMCATPLSPLPQQPASPGVPVPSLNWEPREVERQRLPLTPCLAGTEEVLTACFTAPSGTCPRSWCVDKMSGSAKPKFRKNPGGLRFPYYFSRS